MDQWNLTLALLGGLLLVLSLLSKLVNERLALLSEPLVAVLVGVAVGPAGLDLLGLSTFGNPLTIVEQVARLTVGFAVVGIALRLPADYLLTRWRAMAVILAPGMVAMWLASAAVVFFALDVPVWIALLIGAIVTPTDPVLATTIVTGGLAERAIPKPVRQFLSGEAGANDGLAYPFVLLPALVLTRPLEAALTEWLLRSVLWEVLGAILLGVLLGAAVGRAEGWAHRRDFLEEAPLLTITIALTVAVLGVAKLLGTEGVLAAFVAGVAYNWAADPDDEAREAVVQDVVKRLVTIPAFVVFGVAIPWAAWMALGWSGLAVAAGVLLFRRLPMLLALARVIPPLEDRTATLFAGWFGPIGIAAVFYAALSVRLAGTDLGWIVGSLIVGASVLAHGVTATPLTRWYGHARGVDVGSGVAGSPAE